MLTKLKNRIGRPTQTMFSFLLFSLFASASQRSATVVCFSPAAAVLRHSIAVSRAPERQDRRAAGPGGGATGKTRECRLVCETK